jgi:RND family efflux transporter MFP subunit
VAEGQLLAAKGDTTSAEAQLSYTKIVSPIDGVVTDRPFYAGETAASGSPVITVMDLSQVVARAHISQQEAAHVKAGDAATISVPGQGPDVRAKVTLVSPALDPNSTTIEVWVQAANPGGRLRPGASARVSIVGETVQHAIVAPAAALLTAPDGVTSVIVLDSDNKPHKKHVKVGIRNGDDVQISEGLQGGERVVTVGAFELDKEDEDVLAKTKIQVQAP